MKTLNLSLKLLAIIPTMILFISMTNLMAQDYLITFAGEGASNTVGSVKIENLNQGTSSMLNGADILHLKAVVTGIETAGEDGSGNIFFYPNPMKDLTKMQFFMPETGEAVITLYDISGRKIAQKQDLLSQGKQAYQIEGIAQGLFIVMISSDRCRFTGRLLSSGSGNKAARIEYENSLALKEKVSDSKGTASEIIMQYTAGDRLKLTAVSGNYSTIVTDVPTKSKVINFNFVPVTDGDGNNYPVVQIGSLLWMAENLKTTKYNDFTGIPLAEANFNLTTPAYCWYNNDATTNKNIYGALYNWYTVNTGKLCPLGWRVPNDNEWTALTDYLGGEPVAGGKLKETGVIHWLSPAGSTNETGFTALPGGYRLSNGTFSHLRYNGNWWSSTVSEYGTSARFRTVSQGTSEITKGWNSLPIGFSVRCVRD